MSPAIRLCYTETSAEGPPQLPRRICDWIAWSTEFGARNYLYAGVADVSSGSYISECEETPPSSYVLSAKGEQVQRQVFGELSAIWRKIDPKVEAILA